METYKLEIVGQSADLKLSPTKSKDTGVFIPSDLMSFLGWHTTSQVSFRIFKKDCVKSAVEILSHLPLYSSKSGRPIVHDDIISDWSDYSKMIERFFGSEDSRLYTGSPFSISETTNERKYLYKLEQEGFNVRKLFVAGKTIAHFSKDKNGNVTMRFETNFDQSSSTTDHTSESVLSVDQLPDHSNILTALPLQQIYYGAPGTGKSHKVKEVTDSIAKEFVFRTTFHPDSDYSTFVGAYKPTMENLDNKAYTVGQLIDKLSEIKNTGCTYPCQKFAVKYWYALKHLSATEIKEIIAACGFTDSMKVEIDKSIPVGEELAKNNTDSKIVYSFVPQAFLKAYVAAWQNPEQPVFLVIEEINRGNCAQIFGDIFQLLDRKDGVSEYPIKADQDIRDYLAKEFAGYDLEANILSGEELVLPANLHIWATMNTSDQSLFPIDSAFKRRWDWKYMPIHDAGKIWTIALLDVEYDWWDFVEKINNVIGNMTSSEDKKLGYFFCKACNGKINAETFVNKVVFYLWNDVFKDYELSDKAFQDGEGKLTFNKFYTPSRDANEATIKTLLENLEVKKEVNEIEQPTE